MMSLSRFYTDCKFFQPEGIVKTDSEQSDKRSNNSNCVPSELTIQPENIDCEKDLTANHEPNEGTEDLEESVDQKKGSELFDITNQIEQAYENGYQDAQKKYTDNYRAAEKSLIGMFKQLEKVRETIITNSRQEIIDFTLTIAERVVRYSLPKSDSTITATIDEALQRAVKSEEFNIFIHPDDYKTVKEKSAELVAGLSGLQNIIIKQDDSIERGGAKIESENCTIDATIAGQFETIREELIKRG
jgi:flagellar assembly protein FliH